MRRPTQLFMLAMAMFLATTFTLAVEPAPWGAGDEEFAFDVTWTNLADETVYDVRGTWFHYANDNHKVGSNLFIARAAGNTGFGVGPSYEYMFRKLTKGRFFVGGDAAALGSDLTDAAAISAAAQAGYQFFVGDTAAVRLSFRWQTALAEEDEVLADREINRYAFVIGIALGVNKSATVR